MYNINGVENKEKVAMSPHLIEVNIQKEVPNYKQPSNNGIRDAHCPEVDHVSRLLESKSPEFCILSVLILSVASISVILNFFRDKSSLLFNFLISLHEPVLEFIMHIVA